MLLWKGQVLWGRCQGRAPRHVARIGGSEWRTSKRSLRCCSWKGQRAFATSTLRKRLACRNLELAAFWHLASCRASLPELARGVASTSGERMPVLLLAAWPEERSPGACGEGSRRNAPGSHTSRSADSHWPICGRANKCVLPCAVWTTIGSSWWLISKACTPSRQRPHKNCFSKYRAKCSCLSNRSIWTLSLPASFGTWSASATERAWCPSGSAARAPQASAHHYLV